MRQIIGASAFIAIALSAAPATAEDYPYCLQGREYGYPGNCGATSADLWRRFILIFLPEWSQNRQPVAT